MWNKVKSRSTKLSGSNKLSFVLMEYEMIFGNQMSEIKFCNFVLICNGIYRIASDPSTNSETSVKTLTMQVIYGPRPVLMPQNRDCCVLIKLLHFFPQYISNFMRMKFMSYHMDRITHILPQIHQLNLVSNIQSGITFYKTLCTERKTTFGRSKNLVRCIPQGILFFFSMSCGICIRPEMT